MANRIIPPNQRIPLHCKDCGTLLAEFEQKTDDEITTHAAVDPFGIQIPDTGLQPDGVVIGLCPQCGGKTEFPAKYLPQ